MDLALKDHWFSTKG